MKNKLSKFLQPMDFSSAIEKEIGAIDFGEITASSRRKSKLFLRNFDERDLEEIMRRVGLLSHLAAIGLGDVRITIDMDDAYIHYLKVYHRDIDPDFLLLDLRLSESRFVPDAKFFDDGEFHTYDMIVIEWLSAQNPYAQFDPRRGQLPGQKKPGLGVLKYCFEMMYIVAREIIKDGFLDIPDHVHGAIMYAKKFKFFDPMREGMLRALMRDCARYSLVDISWGIATGTIIDISSNQPLVYTPSEQIFYVSEKLRAYFHSKNYLSSYNRHFRKNRFRFDYEEMNKRRAEIIARRGGEELQ